MTRLSCFARSEPYQIFWLEDFLHPEDYDGYARVKEAGVKTRLAAGEQEATAWGFHELITRGKIDVVQPDLSRCGGFTPGAQNALGSPACRRGRVSARLADGPAHRRQACI